MLEKLDARKGILLPKNFGEKYRKLRAEFEGLHPELATLNVPERIKLWKDFVANIYGPEPEPLCTTCNEAGWVQTREGKAVLCPSCQGKDWVKIKYARLKEYSHLPKVKEEDSFENFKLRPGTKEAFEAVEALANGAAKFKLLLLYGAHGVGKTHLCHAAVERALERQQIAAYWYVPAFYSKWRMEMAEQGGADQFINNLMRCDFLVLDDIGVRAETEAQQAVLEQIINTRYHSELPLLATTNRDPRDMGKAIMSRFNDAVLSRVVPILVSDYRPQKQAGSIPMELGV